MLLIAGMELYLNLIITWKQFPSIISKITSLLIFCNEQIRNIVLLRIESTYLKTKDAGKHGAHPEFNYHEEKY